MDAVKSLKIPRVSVLNWNEIEAAKERLPWEFRPREKDGKILRPLFSKKEVSKMKEATLQAGLEWPFEVPKKEVVVNVPFKGRLRERQAQEKKAEIEENMKKMPQLVEAYKKNRTKRKKTPLGQYLKETLRKEIINST
eukprot:jgi/Galph1/315/GphlegSOOS_G5095.1